MPKRNLRKWEEAKQRQSERAAPRGYWLSGAGRPLFIEAPELSSPVVPSPWFFSFEFLSFEPMPSVDPRRGTVFDRSAAARIACDARRAIVEKLK